MSNYCCRAIQIDFLPYDRWTDVLLRWMRWDLLFIILVIILVILFGWKRTLLAWQLDVAEIGLGCNVRHQVASTDEKTRKNNQQPENESLDSNHNGLTFGQILLQVVRATNTCFETCLAACFVNTNSRILGF